MNNSSVNKTGDNSIKWLLFFSPCSWRRHRKPKRGWNGSDSSMLNAFNSWTSIPTPPTSSSNELFANFLTSPSGRQTLLWIVKNQLERLNDTIESKRASDVKWNIVFQTQRALEERRNEIEWKFWREKDEEREKFSHPWKSNCSRRAFIDSLSSFRVLFGGFFTGILRMEFDNFLYWMELENENCFHKNWNFSKDSITELIFIHPCVRFRWKL